MRQDDSWLPAGQTVGDSLFPCHAMPCHAMPCHAMPCHAMPRLAIPRCATPRHAMPCHAMPCHAMIDYEVYTVTVASTHHQASLEDVCLVWVLLNSFYQVANEAKWSVC